MKICANCYRVNPDEAVTCTECGQTDFLEGEISEPPFYNSLEEYEK